MNADGLIANAALVDEMFERWSTDPQAVTGDWRLFFQGFALASQRGESAAPAPVQPTSALEPVTRRQGRPEDGAGALEQQRVDGLIYAYRDVGHTICELDPLGFANQAHNPNLDLATYGLSESDLGREFSSDTIPGMPPRATLREIIAHLRATYCGHIGVEYQHIQDRERRTWVRQQVESCRNRPDPSREEKRRILVKLSQAEMLEQFIHTKFLGQKRFSLEGGESLMPGLDAVIDLAPELGVEEIVMGMPHRGRLNVLCNIFNKSYEEMFTEFEGSYDPAELQGDGDVKYHLGFSSDHVTSHGKTIHLTLNPNPSHLEAVDPVVLGRVRGKQRLRGDTKARGKVIPILLHGDAAFAGQGLVMECLQLAQLEGYTVGGTIHIIVNNQIGFTTMPEDARSTRSCTDIAKMLEAPVFHVNGDDPEAVAHVCALALRYRQQFHRDVVVDIVCYRRHGHNETDEPNFTQPTMYARIAEHLRTSQLYTRQLLARGDLRQDEVDAIAAVMQGQLQDALTTIKAKPAKLTRKRFTGVWQGLTNAYSHAPVATAAADEALQLVGRALSSWPSHFQIHPKIRKVAEDRGKAVAGRGRVDWALAELLAFGTLLTEKTPVRLSGQDCRRGTFSQRHAVWYDVKTRERYKPLQHIAPDQALFCVYDSPLSEAAVLGFDYGYSKSEPNMLILWEAQFGDFANGAQVIIDQFIASSESKWGRASGIVLMLPHGQEGMGPEHSSARLERFLQACAEDNIQVCNCTTAAQHFHVLRRQLKRQVRKPLILMTPKSHLRSKAASSDYAELAGGRFHEIIGDQSAEPAKVKRLVLCSGKVYHELAERRAEEKLDGIALVRVEQLYPLHDEALKEACRPFAKAELVWCQEETQNMGAWSFIAPHLRRVLGREPAYAGREAAASPAPGSLALFAREQEQLVADALGIPAKKTAKGAH